MEIPTEFSYKTNIQTNHNKNNSVKNTNEKFNNPYLIEIPIALEKDYYEKKRNTYMINNVFNEIQMIRHKQDEEQYDYIELLQISQPEFERSQIEVQQLAEYLNEEHITEIRSLKKLIFVHKNVLEIFSYLIGEPFFDWKNFRDKFNLHEAKYKMNNINYKSLSSKRINAYLNKISKNAKFNQEYIDSRTEGIGVLFKWIKSILKIFLFKTQQNEKRAASVFSSNALSPFNKSEIISENGSHQLRSSQIIKREANEIYLKLEPFKDKEKAKEQTKEKFVVSNNAFTNTENIPEEKSNSATAKNLHQILNKNKNNENLYITEIGNQNNKKPNKTNIPLPEVKFRPKAVKETKMKLNFDCTKIKELKELKTLHSLPFIKNKTFQQLRRFFQNSVHPRAPDKKNNKEKMNNKHFHDLDMLSMKNPNNSNKIVGLVAINKLKALDDHTFNHFLENLHNESANFFG
jgi:hypothetical protein